MESVLYQIYCSEFGPAHSAPKLEQYRKLLDAHCQRHDAFLKKIAALDPALHKELLQLLSEQMDLERMEPAEYFVEGFVMAAKLMVEVLANT